MMTKSVFYSLTIFKCWKSSCKSLITLGPSISTNKHVGLSSLAYHYKGKSVRQYVTSLGNADFTSSDSNLDDSDLEERYTSEDYKSYFDKKKFGSKLTINKLKEVLKCSRRDAEIIVKKFPDLACIPSENLTENINYFQNVNLNIELLQSNPWLFFYKPTAVTSRLKLLEKMGLRDLNDAVPLLKIPLEKFQELVRVAEKEAQFVPGGRIVYLSKRLECDYIDLCTVVAKCTFLLTRKFDMIEAVLNILLGYGMSSKHILGDAWVFQYSPYIVESRLKKAYDSGVKPLKPWMVRAPVYVFGRLLEKSIESKNALGTSSTLNEYLSHRLKCNTEHISALCLRYSPLSKVSVLKVKDILDYLYEEGFSPEQVCHVPRVLCHSLETVQARLNQIRDLGYNPNSLIVLCKSKRQYLEYINKLENKQKHTFAQ